MKLHSIGLALSGGGARGIAHLGVIKALEEIGITPQVISGTSAGAIIGALYAHGYSTNEILKIILEIKAYKFLKPALNTKGFLKMEAISTFLANYIPENDFSTLKIPLEVAVTNIRTGKTEYFNSGELHPIICASCCIPVLFNPIKYKGEQYIDGGILNNLPVEGIRNKADIIIGSHSNPIDQNFEVKNFSSVIERALMLAITSNVKLSDQHCDFLIEPVGLEIFKVMDMSKAKDIFRIGYQQAVEQLEAMDIKNKLSI